jgi:hypothetical protein
VQHISLVILRDVEIEDWHAGRRPVFVRNCLFDRVVLRGFIGDVLLDAKLEALANSELDVALDFYDVNRIAFWLRLADDAELLVANDASPTFQLELDRYRTLRDAGFAD